MNLDEVALGKLACLLEHLVLIRQRHDPETRREAEEALISRIVFLLNRMETVRGDFRHGIQTK
ncbi:MAG: hypothetical protein JRH18_19950 [Deltaproteobacteria bacterium]|nr:hypothetical protein [Deltaproteobacteria bacterium]MBW2153925.1 hypothetical protein [Deltaproteobacteria bacterium]